MYKRGPQLALPLAPKEKQPNALCDLRLQKMRKFDMFNDEFRKLCELFTFFGLFFHDHSHKHKHTKQSKRGEFAID